MAERGGHTSTSGATVASQSHTARRSRSSTAKTTSPRPKGRTSPTGNRRGWSADRGGRRSAARPQGRLGVRRMRRMRRRNRPARPRSLQYNNVVADRPNVVHRTTCRPWSASLRKARRPAPTHRSRTQPSAEPSGGRLRVGLGDRPSTPFLDGVVHRSQVMVPASQLKGTPVGPIEGLPVLRQQRVPGSSQAKPLVRGKTLVRWVATTRTHS